MDTTDTKECITISESNNSVDFSALEKMGLTSTQIAFLVAYMEAGSIRGAAGAVGIHESNHYHWTGHSETYKECFQQCKRRAAESLVDECRRRAMGWDEVKTVVDKNGNEHQITERRYSDTLLIFLMKGLIPETFGDRLTQQISGNVASQVQLYLPDNGRGPNSIRNIEAEEDES